MPITPEQIERLRDLAGYLNEQAQVQKQQASFLRNLYPEDDEEEEEGEESSEKRKKELKAIVSTIKNQRNEVREPDKDGTLFFKGKRIMENKADGYIDQPIIQFN